MGSTSLPSRRKEQRPRIYKFSELLHQNYDVLKSNAYSGVDLDDLELVKNNLDFINKLIDIKYNVFYSFDYDLLKLIDEIVDKDKHISLQLMDDYENKDRSYIDLASFENTTLEIPLPYAFWINADQDLFVNDRISKENLYSSYQDGLSPIRKQNLDLIRSEIYQLAGECRGLDDVEKIIIVSDYLQNRVQYINHDNKSVARDGIYITDLKMSTGSVGNISNVLFNRFGVCRGIADTTTVLLNNPLLNVNVRTVSGLSHSWNVVKLDKNYHIDNTWCITRNPNRYQESLKARSFSGKYLLFGEKTARDIGHHDIEVVAPNIEDEDYNREELKQKVKKLETIHRGIFRNYDKPLYKSYRIQ